MPRGGFIGRWDVCGVGDQFHLWLNLAFVLHDFNKRNKLGLGQVFSAHSFIFSFFNFFKESKLYQKIFLSTTVSMLICRHM